MGVRLSPKVVAEIASGASRLRSARLKRALDVCASLGGLVLLAPVLLVICLLIRLEGPGPALFRQWRTGRNGVPFQIYKLRTMCVIEDGACVVQATRNDPRITRLGSFLRQSNIDELPQLINVLRGEMSLVGPRPHALAHDSQFGAVVAYYDLRFGARPGLTGLAQVSGHRGETPNDASIAQRVDHDLEYIRRWSFALDLSILLQTLTWGASIRRPTDPVL